jgi:hypothetical protein
MRRTLLESQRMASKPGKRIGVVNDLGRVSGALTQFACSAHRRGGEVALLTHPGLEVELLRAGLAAESTKMVMRSLCLPDTACGAELGALHRLRPGLPRDSNQYARSGERGSALDIEASVRVIPNRL